MKITTNLRSSLLLAPLAASLMVALGGCGDQTSSPTTTDPNASKAAESSYEKQIEKEKAEKGSSKAPAK